MHAATPSNHVFVGQVHRPGVEPAATPATLVEPDGHCTHVEMPFQAVPAGHVHTMLPADDTAIAPAGHETHAETVAEKYVFAGQLQATGGPAAGMELTLRSPEAQATQADPVHAVLGGQLHTVAGPVASAGRREEPEGQPMQVDTPSQ